MKDEILVPIQREEDFVAATMRRDKYSAIRDLQAQEFNSAIASRLTASARAQIKCTKCGKEFTVSAAEKDEVICPDCLK
jgi:hypothetical protein